MTNYVCMLDCESTGLGPEHRPWEIAWRVFAVEGASMRQTASDCVQVRLTEDEIVCAEPKALEVGCFHERYDAAEALPFAEVADRIMRDVPKGARLCGSNPGFDDGMVGGLLDRAGYERPWHYRHVDVPMLVAGYLAGIGGAMAAWTADECSRLRASSLKSDELSRLIGVNPERFGRHTAMGDVDWTVAMYAAVHGLVVEA